MTHRLRAVPQTTKTPGSETPISAAGGARKSFRSKYFQARGSFPLMQEGRGTAVTSACPFSPTQTLRLGPVNARSAAGSCDLAAVTRLMPVRAAIFLAPECVDAPASERGERA